MSDELHDLVGPYALGALDGEDAAVFEAHLETCGTCQHELFTMSDVVLQLDSLAAAGEADHLAEPEQVAEVHDLASRRRLPWFAAAAAAVVLIVGLWASGIFETTRVEEIASASDVETISLDGDTGSIQLVLSNEAAGVALDDVTLEALDDPQLYVLWVIRDGAEAPEFVGNITEFADVDQAWDIAVADVGVLAISIENAPSPATPSDQIVYVGQRADG